LPARFGAFQQSAKVGHRRFIGKLVQVLDRQAIVARHQGRYALLDVEIAKAFLSGDQCVAAGNHIRLAAVLARCFAGLAPVPLVDQTRQHAGGAEPTVAVPQSSTPALR
jgi:hypothetical protein